MSLEASRTYAKYALSRARNRFLCRRRESFDDRMAPLIVLSGHPPKDSKGYFVYRDHVEVVLFDEGINVWSHFWSMSAGPSWEKNSFLPFKISTQTKALTGNRSIEKRFTFYQN